MPVDGRDSRPLLSQVWSHRWSVLAVTVLATASAMFFSSRQPAIYAAESKVLVKPAAPLYPQVETVVAPNMATEIETVRSVMIAQRVRTRLGLDETPAELLEHLTVEALPDTEILVLTFTDPRPEVATSAAEEFGLAYLERRRNGFRTAQIEAVEKAQADIGAIEQRLERMNATIEGTTDPVVRASFASRVNLLNQALVQAQTEALDLATPRDLGAVLQSGTFIGRVGPNYGRDVLLGLMLGLILGISQAAIRGRLDDRIRSVEEAEALLGSVSLAAIPRMRARDRSSSPLMLPPRTDPSAPDAFASLRASFASVSARQRTGIVLVTSAWDGEGKTTVAANLGASLARAGRGVTLICAEHKQHGLEHLIGTRAEVGLNQVLEGTAPLSQALVPTMVRNLTLLPCGRAPEGTVEPLNSRRIEACFASVAEGSEIVLVDGPAVLADAEALGLVSLVDAVLLVINARRMRTRALTLTQHQLNRVNAHAIGLVFNFVAPSMLRPALVSPLARASHSRAPVSEQLTER